MSVYIGRVPANFKSCYLKVTYQPGIVNEGVYHNKPDLLNAWQQFTEDDLIREALKY